MKKIIVKGILFIVVAILCLSICGNLCIYANSEMDKIESKINETKNQMDEVDLNKSATMKQLEKLNAEIAEQEGKISELKNDIEVLESQITQTEKDIKEKQELYEENFEKFKVRLVASYEAGKTTYLDVLLASKKMTDVLSNWFYLTEIAKADKAFQETLQKQQVELENSKVSLENSKDKLVLNKENLEKTNQSLKESKNVKQTYMNQLTNEEKVLQDELEQYEKDKKDLQIKLEQLAKQNQYAVQAPNEYGYISPLSGRTTSDIYCGWEGYPGHKGVDYSYWGISGQKILAVKSGVVIISTALKYDNGRYKSYGEYIVIDHQDGSMTLYAHGLPNSRKVSVGEWVTQGQTIMQVGTTGNSTGPHLHFEVRINGRQVNPTPYLP